MSSASGIKVPHLRSELESLLDSDACPTCEHVKAAERSFFSWFRIESFATAEMHAALRASHGLCPAHLSRLIEESENEHVLEIVIREAVSGAQATLQGGGTRSMCPACEAVASATRRASRLLAEELPEPALTRRYREHGGVCLPHLLDAIAIVDAPNARVLTERMLASLEASGDQALVYRLAGDDPDADRRARDRRALPGDEDYASIVEELGARLSIEACPACLAAGWAERRYLEWYAERSEAADPALETDPGELCPLHLLDLNVTESAAAIRAAGRKRTARRAELVRLLSRLPPAAATRRRAGRARELEQASAELSAPHHCPACNAVAGVLASQLDLVAGALGLPGVRERYSAGHGLCVEHALLVDPAQTPLARRHASARLGVLAWELRERARKSAWAFRHEHEGPEHDAWLRAAVQIDGRVRGGGPPVPIG